MSSPYTAEELEERLEEQIDAVLSSRRTARAPAEHLAGRSRTEQEFVLHWVAAIAKTNAEMGYQVANLAAEALQQLDTDAVESWILEAIDEFDRQGLTAGVARVQALEEFVAQHRRRVSALELAEVRRVLEGFVHGLSGRILSVEVADQGYTDTAVVYLPELLEVFPTPEENFSLYKVMAAHLWAQCRYGTWQEVERHTWEAFEDQERATRLFHRLETCRLDAVLARELPGIARLQGVLSESLKEVSLSGIWQEAQEALSVEGAGASDSWNWLEQMYAQEEPQPRCYQGVLRPQQAQEVREARIDRERQEFREALAVMREQEEEVVEQGPGQFRLLERESDAQDLGSVELLLDDRPIEPPDSMVRLMTSIHQDLGEIPEEYLSPAGPGEYDAQAQPETSAEDVWKGTYHEEGAWHYREWDHVRGSYRKDWCVLRERPVHAQYDAFPQRTLKKYHGLAHSLLRTFEIIRASPALLRREPDGEDVDLDALVQALSDARTGREMTQRVFTRQARNERSIAVMFMVDMSGSTKGWVNEVEREALILLCEALQRLQDQYAIYGFSGITRKRCEVFSIKRFDEAYDDTVAARISGILPQDYTRMGAAIRHLSEQLNQVDARSKLLITLSDGRPEDYTDYRGEYGIEDTRQALLEARRSGIHSFCITIDEEGQEYLPHMYGLGNYTVVSDIRRLPYQVSDIYRRLTT